MGNELNGLKDLALYLHVPFCARKCAYCDFASFAGREAVWEDYFRTLQGEIEAWRDKLRGHQARSIFFGGGTPSLVPAGFIADTLEGIRNLIAFDPEIEITLEANPGTLDMEKLRAYRDAGINRLSIGVQSFDADLLRELGRIHTPEIAEAAVLLAREAGFENISIDLMYGLPGQDMAKWQESLRRAIVLPVKHISAYSLIVEEGTQMHERVESGAVQLPGDEVVNEMQRMAGMMLARAGFERYEISNYAHPGFESRHNITYWQGGDYLGLGSAAHSLFENARFSNPPELERYLAGKRMLEYTKRSIADRREERLMLETRMVRGLDLEAWQRDFGDRLEETTAGAIEKLMRYGLVEIENGYLRLTAVGLELQDSVVLELMDD